MQRHLDLDFYKNFVEQIEQIVPLVHNITYCFIIYIYAMGNLCVNGLVSPMYMVRYCSLLPVKFDNYSNCNFLCDDRNEPITSIYTSLP